jgi:hypothetical protein
MTCKCGKDADIHYSTVEMEWVCKECGLPAPEEMQPSSQMTPVKLSPTLYTMHIVYEVYVRMPFKLGRVEAARRAIGLVRYWIEDGLYEDGLILTQACPRLYLNPADSEDNHWMVRIILQRKTKKLDMGWEDLLDQDPDAIMYGR